MASDEVSETSAKHIISNIWTQLELPHDTSDSLRLESEGLGLSSSFKIGQLAQASMALSALSAALIYSHLNQTSVPKVTVPLQHAVTEFKSQRLMTVDGQKVPSLPPIGGLHKTADGYIRIHDSFITHRNGIKKLLGCPGEDDRDRVAAAVLHWKALDLEKAAIDAGLAATALRSYDQWDALPQAEAIANSPVIIRKIASGPPGLPLGLKAGADKSLRGLRVVEMTRVIAGPVAGKTLAAHGADILWVTSPNLPSLPSLDRDVGRGKRTISLDINQSRDKDTLEGLLETADVFLQSYRPGSLAAKGLSPERLASKSQRGIISATLSAYGAEGPWSRHRGFDSLVQTATGINVSEAEHFGSGEASKVLPCQALDHASGYFLATGIAAALYRQATEGGSYEVQVSLAGTGKFLRGLGQYEGRSGFECKDFNAQSEVPQEFLEDRDSGFGVIRAVKHSASIEGVEVGWDVMPKPLGSDKACWLP